MIVTAVRLTIVGDLVRLTVVRPIYTSRCLLVMRNSGSLLQSRLRDMESERVLWRFVWPTGLACSKALVCSHGDSLEGGEPCISLLSTTCSLDGHVHSVASWVFSQQRLDNKKLKQSGLN